jgi:hypothetical protein
MPVKRRLLTAIPVGASALVLAMATSSNAWADAATATSGYDVGYPQCSASLPKDGAFGIVGVNDGVAWSTNPCLASEYQWAAAKSQAGFYMNTANPGPVSSHWNLGGPRECLNPASASDQGCAYDYGWNAAAYAFSAAAGAISAAAAAGHAWWADVETMNSWNGDQAANAADVQGGLDYLLSQGVPAVGVYSTPYQWAQITGGYTLAASVSDWVAGASNARQAARMCSSAYSFSGGAVTLVQYPSGRFDGDYRCP